MKPPMPTRSNKLKRRNSVTRELQSWEAKLFDRVFSSEVFVIASIPFFAYFLVYIRYMSYLQNFKIPSSLIDFELSVVITTFLLVLSLLFVVMLLTSFLMAFIIGNKVPSIYVIFLSTYFVIFIFTSLATDISKHKLIFTPWVATLIFILILIRNTYIDEIRSTEIANPPKRGLIVRFWNLNASLLDRFSVPIRRVFKKNLGENITLILMIYFGMLLVAYAAGITQYAVGSYYYDVLNSNPECVILYQTSRIAVCAPLDRKNREVEASFKIIDLLKDSTVFISHEDLGRLTSKPIPSPTPLPTSTPTITPTATITLLPTSSPLETITPSPSFFSVNNELLITPPR